MRVNGRWVTNWSNLSCVVPPLPPPQATTGRAPLFVAENGRRFTLRAADASRGWLRSLPSTAKQAFNPDDPLRPLLALAAAGQPNPAAAEPNSPSAPSPPAPFELEHGRVHSQAEDAGAAEGSRPGDDVLDWAEACSVDALRQLPRPKLDLLLERLGANPDFMVCAPQHTHLCTAGGCVPPPWAFIRSSALNPQMQCPHSWVAV